MDRNGIINAFLNEYGAADGSEIRVFFAPLRVNLIGEYTDVAGGFVLPCALNMGIYAATRRRSDNIIRLKSADDGLSVCIDAGKGLEFEKEDGWANYPKGVVNEILKLGKEIKGADIFYAADSKGFTASGLSSSAAMEVLTGVIFNELYGLEISGADIALLSQRAENNFVGVMCGIMDQFAVMMGRKNNAILLDCETLKYEYIPFELDKKGLKLVIMNTNKKRGLLDSKYNERRGELDASLKDLKESGEIPQDGNLLSIRADRTEVAFADVNEKPYKCRARHVYNENMRVKEAARALSNNDFKLFGKLLEQSHRSLNDDFDVTGPELNALQDAAKKAEGCIGSRMTGAGFGGCALAIVEDRCVEDFIREVSDRYTEKTGLEAGFFVSGAAEGAGERSAEVGK